MLKSIDKKEFKSFSSLCLLTIKKEDGINLTEEEIQKARNEDGETLYSIGEKYYDKNSYSKALAWYRLAEAQNYSEAQFKIGFLYERGFGVPTDYQQAMDWFLKAANNDGNSSAQCYIGSHYQNGHGVPKNIHTAIKWYTKAANQGYSNAQFNLGCIYENHEEVKDLQKAVNWYKKAVDNSFIFHNDGLKRLSKQGYYPKEDAKEIKQSSGSNETRLESNNRAVNSDDQQEQLPLTNQNDENRALQMEERLKKLEEAFQQKMDIFEREKKALEQARSENDYLKENLNRLEEENKRIRSEQGKKDEEINHLKEALAKHSIYLGDNTNNDFNYDSSNDNESDTNNGGDTECDDSDKDGNRENDINYDSSDSEDRTNDLNYEQNTNNK